MNNIKNYAILICNLQTKTINNLFYKDKVIFNVNKLSHMKKYIPSIKLSILSEFEPEKFGHSHPSINKSNIDMIDIINYNENHSIVNNYLIHLLSKHKISNIILSGMETQWCIKNTAQELIDLEYNVFIQTDAIGNNLSNKDNIQHMINFKNMNAQLTTTNSLIYNLAMDHKNNNDNKK
jgi:nicotinamidase-related amidase